MALCPAPVPANAVPVAERAASAPSLAPAPDNRGMPNHPARLALVLLLVALCGWRLWDGRAQPIPATSGWVAPDEPVQERTWSTLQIERGHWTLTPRAHYDITARVLGVQPYSRDAISDLSFADVALGWGPMSDGVNLSALRISQSVRFLSWHADHGMPVVREVLESHVSNNHVIAATPAVQSRIAALKVGQVVHLRGLLVDAVRDDGRAIRTSLTRTDTGAGACEVMLVDLVEARDAAGGLAIASTSGSR